MRAVMLEVLRVLAGYEFLGFEQGTDTDADKAAAKHHKVRSPIQIEAGAFQVSANSMVLAPELKTSCSKESVHSAQMTSSTP